MLDISRDIHSLTDFKKNTSKFVEQLKETGEPVVLTINGKAELVVQDATAYQKLLQISDEARVLEGVRQGIEDMVLCFLDDLLREGAAARFAHIFGEFCRHRADVLAVGPRTG